MSKNCDKEVSSLQTWQIIYCEILYRIRLRLFEGPLSSAELTVKIICDKSLVTWATKAGCDEAHIKLESNNPDLHGHALILREMKAEYEAIWS